MLKMLLDASGGELGILRVRRKRRERRGEVIELSFCRRRRRFRPSSCLNPLPLPKKKKKNETIQSPIPGIVLTNDGNAILREIDVSHPAAKVRVENGEKKEGPLFFRLRLLLFFLLCFSPLSPPSVVALFFFFKILFQPKKQH